MFVPSALKIWVFLLNLKNFSVYSGFGQVVEFQEVLPIFLLFFDIEKF